MSTDFGRLAFIARRVARVALAVCIGAAPRITYSQSGTAWDSLGPPGGAITSLLTSPVSTSTLYAGTPENGLFVSTDAGTTWASANTGLPASTAVGRQKLLTIHALVTDGQLLYVATGAGLYSSMATASPNWTALPSTGSNSAMSMLAFDPGTRRLFAASAQPGTSLASGVYSTSIDPAGVPSPAWAFNALPGATGVGVTSMGVVATQGGNGGAGLLVGMDTSLFAASIDPANATLHWANADPSAALAGGPVTTLLYSTDFLQAYACSGGGAFYSGNPLDAQPIWLPLSTPASGTGVLSCNTFASISVAVGGAPQMLLGTDQGALVSLDGVTFASTGRIGAGASANAFAVAMSPGAMSSSLFAGSGSGVVRTSLPSLTGGASWSPSNGPASVAAGGTNLRLNNANIVDSAIVGNTLFAAAVGNQQVEVFASADGGVTWSETHVASVLGAGEEVVSLAADSTHGVLFAATTQGLLVHSVAAAQWSQVGGGMLAGRIGALALGTNALYAGTDDGLYAVPLSAAPASALPVAAGLAGASVRSLLAVGGSVYAGVVDSTDGNFVFTTSETAASSGAPVWTQFGVTSTGTQRITSLLLIGSTLLASTNGSLVLYASTGSAWSSANTSTDPSQQISDTFGAVTSLYSDGNLIFASTRTNGVFVTAVGPPFSWIQTNGTGATALPSMEVHSLKGSAGILYAATRGGIASLAGLGGGAASPPTPAPTPAPPPNDSGGGAFDAWLAMALIAAVVALRRRGRRG